MSTNAILRAGHAVPLTKGGLGLLAPGDAPLSVDTSAMSATVVISHRSVDRTGDLVEPAGIDAANFAKNPTVLLNHGKDYALPIGRALDPEGNLTVKAEKDRVIATTYFAPTREGEQVFELVSQGFLNGASIGFSPLEERPIARGGHHYLRWELLEYSHVTTPACPNAAEVLRRCLSRGRVAGAPISEPLRKSLECMARPAKAWANGATLNEDEAMSKKWKKATPKAAETTPATKAAPPPPGKPAAQQQQPDPAAQGQAPPPAPAAPDLPTLLGQLTALIGQLTTIAQPAAPPPAGADMPPEGAGEQAEGDEDFDLGDESEDDAEEDADSSGDGMSEDQADDAEDEEETEELLQRYRAGEPAVTKDMTETDGQAGGYLTDAVPLGHKAVCRAVADHLDEMASCEPGSTYTHSHKAAFAHHAKAMKEVCRAMDAGEGDTPEAANEPTEKALDLDAASILDALKPLNAKVADFDEAIYSITGRKAS